MDTELPNTIGYGIKMSESEIAILRKKAEVDNLTVTSTVHFDPVNHCIATNDSKKMNYSSRDSDKTHQAWGQLKLFVTLVDFLNICYDPSVHHSPTLLYIGAAPGRHLTIVSEFFPKIKFELYDNEHFDPSLENNDNFVIHRKYFDEEEANMWANRQKSGDNVFLVSDIRTRTYKADLNEVNVQCEKAVWNDMITQESWVKIIKPTFSQLKFRLPYYDAVTIDMFNGNEVDYLAGTIYFQPYVKSGSSETRLIVDGSNLKTIKYDFKEYEAITMYHNSIVRELEFTKFYSIFDSDGFVEDNSLGITPNWDSTKFMWVIKTFLENSGVQPTRDIVLSVIAHIDNVIAERASSSRRKTTSKRRSTSRSYGLSSLSK